MRVKDVGTRRGGLRLPRLRLQGGRGRGLRGVQPRHRHRRRGHRLVDGGQSRPRRARGVLSRRQDGRQQQRAQQRQRPDHSAPAWSAAVWPGRWCGSGSPPTSRAGATSGACRRSWTWRDDGQRRANREGDERGHVPLWACRAASEAAGAGDCDPCTACGLCVEKRPDDVDSIIASGATQDQRGERVSGTPATRGLHDRPHDPQARTPRATRSRRSARKRGASVSPRSASTRPTCRSARRCSG